VFNIRVCHGTARLVFLINQRYAVKIARLRLYDAWYYRRWRELLEGVKANKAERQRWKASQDVHLCPVLFSDILGVFVVMPYARPLTDKEFGDLELEYIIEGARAFGRVHHRDFKRENYGMLHDRTVRIDYED
jgi:hypothetical protein